MSSLFVSRLCRLMLLVCGLQVATLTFAAPGDRDASFGDGGALVYTAPGMFKTWALRAFEQTDGKIVAVGYVQSTSVVTTQDFLVLRFNADGSLDSTFGAALGTPGRVQIDFSGFADLALGGIQQADGKLIVVGNAGANSNVSTQMAAVRLLPDGQLDLSFGLGGRQRIGAISTNTSATDAFVLADGAIIVGGSTLQDVVLARLLPNGIIDAASGFGAGSGIGGGNGIARLDIRSTDITARVIRQTDGRFTVVGRSLSPGPVIPGPALQSLFLTRFNGNGSLDTTFGSGGVVTAACSITCNWTGLTQQPNDGKLVVSGFNFLEGVGNPPLQQQQSVVLRFNTDGSSDTTFGNNGSVTGLFVSEAPTFITSGDQAVESYVDPVTGDITILGAMDSRTYNAAGTSGVGTFASTALARVSANGTLNRSYGYSGISLLTYITVPPPIVYNVITPRTLVPLQNGRALVVGLAGDYVNAVPQAQAVALSVVKDTGADAGVLTIAYQGPIKESIGHAVLRVFRNSGSTGAISVEYSTVSGTAEAGRDFEAASGVLNWADGDYSIKFVSIPIITDTETESVDETFSLALANATGNAYIGGRPLQLTIVRDDVEPASSVTLSQDPLSVSENAGSVNLQVSRTGSSPISVNYYTIPGTASKGTDYTTTSGILVWGAGETAPKTISVPIVDDAINEAPETVRVVLVTTGGAAVFGGQTAVVTITDNDQPPQVGFVVTSKSVSESDGVVMFEVTRVGATSQSVSVNYATASGTATAGSDYQPAAGVLTWTPSDADTKSVTITILDDSLHEGSQEETFAINLTGATGGALVIAGTATTSIIDNDPAPQLSFEVARVKVNERDSSVTLSVTRTGASGLIHSVDFATRDGSAHAGKDYVATNGTLTWLATDPDTKTVTVPIIRKPRREDNENFKVDLSNASGATIGLAECKVVITEKPRN